MAWIDITQKLESDMVLWPGSEPLQIHALERIEDGGGCNTSAMTLDLHSGTHIDAPWHMLETGERLQKVALEKLIGPALVVDITGREGIGRQDLEKLELGNDVKRLLLRSDTSERPIANPPVFRTDFPALTKDAADFLVERGIELVGIDSPSIEAFRSPGHPVHKTLLGAGVAVIEGLQLANVATGSYDLICLPLSLQHVDASPVRALLQKR